MQKFFFFLIAATILFFSCQDPVGKESQEKHSYNDLVGAIDSLQKEIALLKTAIEHEKEESGTPDEKQKKPASVTPAPVKPSPQREPAPAPMSPPAPPPPTKKVVTAPANDTIRHYYVNGALSVLITPWENGKRQYFLYDLYSNVTYEMEEVQLSYQISIRLSFHKNGAVKTANIHTNPGASRYMHSSEITFGTTNDPLTKTSKRIPQDTIEEVMEANRPWFWNKRTKQWVRQEIVEEMDTPVPD